MDVTLFQELILQKGHELYRDMPWRTDTRPYYVLVSELMLQQTQVIRVIPKFIAFIEAFPDEKALANATLGEVLILWQGLGYNRRAKFLHEAAKMLVGKYETIWPIDEKGLLQLPGVGKNTSGAIRAYAFNQPSIFIETNIRTVFFYHFFASQSSVTDGEIRTLLEESIDSEHPREWYWALMDYGSWLKSQGFSGIDQSKHYKKQPPLEGSVRQVRGKIISALAREGTMTLAELQQTVGFDERFHPAVNGLIRDGLVVQKESTLYLTK